MSARRRVRHRACADPHRSEDGADHYIQLRRDQRTEPGGRKQWQHQRYNAAAEELTAINGNSTGWSYDPNGNETAGNSSPARTAETYTASNQLSSISVGGGATAMRYAGLSIDERASAGATTYQSGELGLANQTAGAATVAWTRDPGGTLISERIGGASYYYIFDGIGSVVALVTATGTPVDTYSYDPQGNVRGTTGTLTNPFQYTGGYKDTTGLYHLGGRYYDPNLGRFTQQDPSGQDSNHYAYAGNNPSNFADPSGRSCTAALGFVAPSGPPLRQP